MVGILGRNGMGKTTLIRSVLGFTPPRRGRVVFKESVLTRLRPLEISRLGISFVPQGRQVFPSLSVAENLSVVSGKYAGGWTMEKIYELFPPLKQRANQPGNTLSGGNNKCWPSVVV